MKAQHYTYNSRGEKVNVTIPAREEEVPDEVNPTIAFQCMSSELISKFAKGEYDIDFYLRMELANRGLDINGKWIGFEAAKAEHKIYL